VSAPDQLRALRRKAIVQSLAVAARVFERAGRGGAATMARQMLVDHLDHPRVDDAVLASRSTNALALTRDAHRARIQMGEAAA